jgi:DNA-binding response OmpR family regulator
VSFGLHSTRLAYSSYQPHPEEGRCFNLQQTKILYAEDYDLVLFTVKQLLELESWQVDICRDGAAARKKLEGDEHYDLIILDAELPGESGLSLVQRARRMAHRRRIPIILFTGSIGHDDALAAGADAFLNKPTGLKNLITTCNSLLDAKNGNRSDTGELQKLAGNSGH